MLPNVLTCVIYWHYLPILLLGNKTRKTPIMQGSRSCSNRSLFFHPKDDGKMPKIPLEPLLAFQAAEKSSKLFENVLEAAKYPPLMQPRSWTKAVPFKVFLVSHWKLHIENGSKCRRMSHTALLFKRMPFSTANLRNPLAAASPSQLPPSASMHCPQEGNGALTKDQNWIFLTVRLDFFNIHLPKLPN